MEAQNIGTKILIGPNIASGDWTPESVWDAGFVDAHSDNLAFLAVEQYVPPFDLQYKATVNHLRIYSYPNNNCFAQFGTGTYKDPQTEFPSFLDHSAGKNIVSQFLNSTAYAQSKNKPFLMFETNTASCGGFAGISDSFGAALWGLDYGMQMAHSNFSGAMFHFGGQNVFYNVGILRFSPVPTANFL